MPSNGQFIPLSDGTVRALELPALLAVVSRLAATDIGRERILELRPHALEEALLDHRRRYDEAARLAHSGRLIPSFEEPLGEVLARLGSGHGAGGSDLVHLAAMLRAVREAHQRIDSADPACPALAAATASLTDLSQLERRIGRSLDPRGEVRADASPALVKLRDRILRLRDGLYREMRDYVQANREVLSEETVPMRGGRLVLTLQAGARGRLPGLTHGRSGSGRSFYFEPLEVVESNNQLQQSVDDEEAEKQRILAELLQEARQARPELEAQARLLAELDLLQSCLRLAELTAGRMIDLSPADAGAGLRLVGGRHPLLDPRLAELRQEALGHAGHQGEVVPLDVELTAERRILVITGPNAGGKTVALKTTGLLALATLCGLPVPAAAGSRIPMLRGVVATVGDDQDLLADRSTFSGRLLRLQEVWEIADAGTLVLLDELGSGTDPEEGAALAVALLESLLQRSSLGIITSHLVPIASAALELPGASCAAMEFDPASGSPTFRLVPGPPGGSEALALARRLGLAPTWLDRAEALLGPEHRDLRRMLAEIETLRRELAERNRELEVETADAAKLRQRLQVEESLLREERQSLAGKLRRELEEFRRATTGRLREEVERLEESVRKGRRRGLEGAAVKRLFETAPSFAEEQAEAEGGVLEVGAPVRHRTLGWRGVLEKLDGGRAEVRALGKKLRCRADELVPATREELPGATRKARRRPPVEGSRDLAAPPGEVKLIGLRVEPALLELDAFLDRSLLADSREVRVVHGHGSGRLRDAVREFLRSHPAVATYRPGGEREGGDGATVVTLGSD